MRKALSILLALVAVSLGGCTIRTGNYDFANPWFDLQCGPVMFIAFHDSTVVHIGTTYFTLSLPFYAPLIFILVLAGLFLLLKARRRRA